MSEAPAVRVLHHTVEAAGNRLDRELSAAFPDLSRAQLQRLIETDQVSLNQRIINKASQKLAAGDELTVTVPPPAPSSLAAEEIPLSIVYEDGDVIVVDKPAGMVVHPAAGHGSGTLVNAVLGHDPNLEGVGDEQRPGVVHRLDKDTSGLIILAKNDQAHRFLQAQFKDRLAHKVYWALVIGRPPSPSGIVEASLGRDPKNRQRMAIVPAEHGRPAVTEYRTLESFRLYTLLEAEPKTGRTHQIRVHFNFLKCPIAGDSLYATPRTVNLQLPMLHRQFLHAAQLTLQLPQGDTRTFKAPLPPDLAATLEYLRAQ